MRIGIGTSIVGGGFIGTSAPATEYLDEIEGAGTPTAAYSVDKVVSTYTDAVVRVRRASDNEEADVAFDNDTITLDSAVDNFSTGSLSATLGEFVANASYSDPDSLGSPDDAFVATWYDQAGSNDATQVTGNDQPKIVSSGALVTENGKVALEFDGSDDYFNLGSSIPASAISEMNSFEIITTQATDKMIGLGAVTAPGPYSIYASASTTYIANRSVTNSISNRFFGQQLFSMDTKNLNGWQNGNVISFTSTTSVVRFTDFNAISRLGNEYGKQKMQLAVYYASDKSALRTAIEDNINGRFSIYP